MQTTTATPTETFEIKIVESVHYDLKISAKSLKEAKAIAKDIRDGHLFITDYSGDGTPVHYGKLKAKVIAKQSVWSNQPRKNQPQWKQNLKNPLKATR